ncbi:DegT/DnrJ/EryC1/StrS family aminotransferase [Bacillus sonorensis]|nr:DegT/DnrJ/EryC1/StrS family aminotransferase [Bacillus sonorensis]
MIPLINLKRQFQTVKHEILKEFERVLDSGQYILGPKVKELEKKIAEKLGVRDAVGVANGTDALVLTLEAYGIGKGMKSSQPLSLFSRVLKPSQGSGQHRCSRTSILKHTISIRQR